MSSAKGKNIFALVMAGGRGERFWPLSRIEDPKPFVRFTKSPSLIEKTVRRIRKFTPLQNIFIATNSRYMGLIKKTLKNFPAGNIIGEPAVRDTAPCICLSASIITARAKSSDAVMVVLPADHLIDDEDSFASCIKDAAKIARNSGSVITIGIKPTHPSSAYGYIQCGSKNEKTGLSTVFRKGLSFIEKPDARKAKILLKKGNFLWNAGIFVWSLGSFQNLLQKHNPELYRHFLNFRGAVSEKDFSSYVERNFSKMKKKSIDYALMEKLENFLVAEAKFDWDDIGSWDSIAKYFGQDNNKNRHCAPHLISVNSNNNIVADYSGRKHLFAMLDVDDLIVINHSDVTLLCRKSSAQKLKELVKKINAKPKLRRFL